MRRSKLRQQWVVRRPKRRSSARRRLSPAEQILRAKCSDTTDLSHFIWWCKEYVYIEGESGPELFKMWPGQLRMAAMLVCGDWALALKGRQVGFTWLIAAWVLWNLIFRRQCRAFVIAQEVPYAEEFVRRVRFMWDALPGWCKPELTKDTEKRLIFDTGGMGAEIRAMAGGGKSARSLTGDLVVFDEASRIDDFAGTMAAVQPVIEKRGGQMVVLSTSAGPVGGYYDLWKGTFGDVGELLDSTGKGPTGFSPLFIHWSQVPGRDRAWFDRQKATLDILDPILVKQEYPETISEAWEFAAGRIHPAFSAVNVGDIVKVGADFIRYRAVDWGENKSAYVVLWIAVLERAPPALLISPNCPNTIRELTSYRFDEDTHRPMKGGDHTCDALRYAVTTFRLTGLVYVYRETYVLQSLSKGWTPMRQVKEIHEQSGWVRGDIVSPDHWVPGRNAELFDRTVCDRSPGGYYAHFTEHQIPSEGNVRLKGFTNAQGIILDDPYAEKMAGIQMINNLIDATEPIEKFVDVRRNEMSVRAAGIRVSTSLIDRRRRSLARDLLKKSRTRRT